MFLSKFKIYTYLGNNMQNEEKLIIDNFLFCLSNISVFIPITVSPISNIILKIFNINFDRNEEGSSEKYTQTRHLAYIVGNI